MAESVARRRIAISELQEDFLSKEWRIELDQYPTSDGCREVGETARIARDDVAEYDPTTTERGFPGHPVTLKNPDDAMRVPGAAILGPNSVDSQQEGKRIGTAEDFDFLGGTWLENGLFNRVRGIFEGRNDTTIAMGQSVSVEGADGKTTEFETVIQDGDRLDLVRAKAVTGAKGLDGALAKLDSHRSPLCGDSGSAILVAPLIEAREAKDLQKSAENTGISFYFDRNAVHNFEPAIRISHRL